MGLYRDDQATPGGGLYGPGGLVGATARTNNMPVATPAQKAAGLVYNPNIGQWQTQAEMQQWEIAAVQNSAPNYAGNTGGALGGATNQPDANPHWYTGPLDIAGLVVGGVAGGLTGGPLGALGGAYKGIRLGNEIGNSIAGPEADPVLTAQRMTATSTILPDGTHVSPYGVFKPGDKSITPVTPASATTGNSGGSQMPGSGPTSFAPGDASSLSGIANEAFSAANSNRAWEMGQNGIAQGYYAPAQSAYQGLFGQGGQLAGPGAGEQAFSQHGGDVLQQNPDQSYYNSMIGGLSQPGAGQQAYAQVAPQLAQQGSFEQQAGGYQQALAQPGAAQNYQTSTLGQVSNPGQFEQQSTAYQGALSGPSNAQQAYNGTAGGYQAPTALESAYGGLMSGYGQQGRQQQAAGGLASSLNGGQSQNTYAAQQKQLQAPGQLEQFAASDAAGNNPYYDQLRQTTNASLDQEFNAGGNYNSGARFAALAKADSNLAAQQYQQEGQLQGQAQGATQSRLGAQAALAGQASSEQLGRTQAQSNLLGTADQQQLQRLGGQAGLAGDVSGQSLNYLNSGIQAAQGTDQTNLARIQAGASIGQGAQAAANTRLQTGGQLAQNAQSDAYNQLLGGASIGQQSQQDALARQQLAISGGMQSQAAGLASTQLGGQLANNSTVSGQNAYQDYQSAAQNAQAAAQGRGQLGFSDTSGLAQNQAATQQGFATNASDAYANMIGSGLGAQTNAIAFQAQQAQNQQAYQLALLGLGIKGATAAFPNGIGGAPPGTSPQQQLPGISIPSTSDGSIPYSGVDYGAGEPTPQGTDYGQIDPTWTPDNPYGTG